jgi:aminoglycoside 3-N-acetyltransferase
MKAMDYIKTIASDLRSLGVHPGGVLMAHSSLKSLGWLPHGPETVIRGLLSALGEGGTLLMPALTYESVGFDHPVFDQRFSPVCVGAIPEYFRTRPGVLRSLHPTHSVCGIGPLASELLSSHIHDSTPCGPNSPFHCLPDFYGQILMLGCGLRPNTSMHAIEELVEPPYLFSTPITYTLMDEKGRTFQKEYTRHNFNGWQQRYDRVAEILGEPHLRFGKVWNASTYLIDAAALRTAALGELRKNPLFFVERVPSS